MTSELATTLASSVTWDGRRHLHHLVDHRVELVFRDIDAIKTAREVHVLITAQYVDLAD
jgi:hypothetical protein